MSAASGSAASSELPLSWEFQSKPSLVIVKLGSVDSVNLVVPFIRRLDRGPGRSHAPEACGPDSLAAPEVAYRRHSKRLRTTT